MHVWCVYFIYLEINEMGSESTIWTFEEKLINT